ncbi:hypothetical protein JW964_03985 [candidate division KSB1 bacterium]|nr:hypothetical protein [candidate division KSB1 bacterium]
MRKLIIFIVLFPCLVWSQKGARPDANQRKIRTTMVYQQYTVEGIGNPISEISVPIQFFWPVNSDLNILLINTPGLSQYGEYELSGLSDLYVKTNYLFLNKKALFGIGLGLPSGQTELTKSEFVMAQLLSNNALRFQLPVFGQGFSGNFGLCFAHPMNDNFNIGFGLTYVFRSKYKPVEDSFDDFDPGDIFSLNAGVDFNVQKNIKIYLDVLYTLYFKDKIRSRQTFGAGSKLSIEAGFLYRQELYSILAYANLRQRGKNEYWTGTSLEPESKNSNGPQLEFDGTFRYVLNEQTGALGFAVLRAYGENEHRSGDAAIGGLGIGIDHALSMQFTVDAGLKFYFGRLGGGKNAKGITGYEFLVGGTASF